MARNEEKAQSMLNRFITMKQEEKRKPRERRPYLASECRDLADADRWRGEILREIGVKVAEIQNEGLGEHRLGDLNDEINKLLRERGHWERRILELGGRDYSRSSNAPLMTELDGNIVAIPNPSGRGPGYRYFGAAKKLPGVHELFDKPPEVRKRRTRYEIHKRINAGYYGKYELASGRFILFTVFAGLEECIKFIANFKFTEDDISFLQSVMPMCEDAFFEYLREIDCSDVEVYSIPEGSVVFPKVPLMRVEGPVAVVQLLETPFVNLINYASLVTTNAARHRHVAGKSKVFLCVKHSCGFMFAGADGAISASKYCFMGGFDATSNVLAGHLFGIPLRGTHSHAYVSSYMSLDEITDKALRNKDGSIICKDFVSLVKEWLHKIQVADSLCGIFGETNQSELAAFASYALAFPSNFLALVDTYDVMRSGIPNFCAVALALHDLGYGKPIPGHLLHVDWAIAWEAWLIMEA